MTYDRRLKIFRMGESEILSLLSVAGSGALQCMAVMNKEVPPEGAVVVGVYGNSRCRTIDVMVWSAAFDVVPDGCEIPAAKDTSGLRIVDLDELLTLRAKVKEAADGEDPERDIPA